MLTVDIRDYMDNEEYNAMMTTLEVCWNIAMDNYLELLGR